MAPFSPGALRSIYHIRQREVFKLSLIKDPIDIFISHDWPRHIAYFGDTKGLLRRKDHFHDDVASGQLGAPALQHLLHLHVPRYWFAAHLHVKFAAIVPDLGIENPQRPRRNDANIDFLSFSHLPDFSRVLRDSNKPAVSHDDCSDPKRSFTQFLALDKVLPRREFMQYLSIDQTESFDSLKLTYDSEWLAIVRATALKMPLRDPVFENQLVPLDSWDSRLEEARAWIDENVSDMVVPMNFSKTAPQNNSPFFKQHVRERNSIQATRLQFNPQADEYCNLLGLKNEVCYDGITSDMYEAE